MEAARMPDGAKRTSAIANLIKSLDLPAALQMTKNYATAKLHEVNRALGVIRKDLRPFSVNRTAPFRDGALIVFGRTSSLVVLVILPNVKSSSDDLSVYCFTFGTVAPHILNTDGELGDELVLKAIEGSSGYLTLVLFEPLGAQVTILAKDLYHGEAIFANLDADPELELIVSYATGDRRFDPCNQCASRRATLLFNFVRERGRYVVAGGRQTATDLFTCLNPNLYGLSPLVFLKTYRDNIQAAMRRIRANLPDFKEDRLEQDAAMILIAMDHLRTEGDYDQILTMVDQLLAELPTSRQVPKAIKLIRNRAHFFRLQALLFQRRFQKLEEATRDKGLVMAMKDSKDLRGNVHNLLVLGRLESGEFDSAHLSLLGAAAEYPGERKTAIEGNLAWYLMLIGDHKAARTTALQALDALNRKSSWAEVMSIMIRLAGVAAAVGNYDEALDWLSRIMRLANSRRDSASTSIALAIAAGVALRLGEGDVTLRLLDHALTLTTAESWPTYASSVLRLYGLGLAASGRKGEAGLALDAAIMHGARQGGADYVAALVDRSRLAAAEGELDAAMELSRRAFAAVLDGRARVGVEAHKISFIGASEAAAQHHLDLLSSSDLEVEQLLNAIEAWRLQVFRDVYRKRVGWTDKDAKKRLLHEQIRLLLGSEDAFASFVIGEERSFAVVIPSTGRSRVVQLPIDSVELRRLRNKVDHWMNAAKPEALTYIKTDRLPNALVVALRHLHDVLIAPLKLDDRVKTLVVSPDSKLVGLPWPALIQPDQSFLDWVMKHFGLPNHRYLVQQRAVAVLPSLQVFLAQSQKNDKDPIVGNPIRQRPSALLVGGFAGVPKNALATAFPVLARNSSNLSQLAPLSAGERELSAIRTTLQGTYWVTTLLDSTSLAGKKQTDHEIGLATHSTMFRILPDASMVHIAAHGIFAPHAPMSSAIFLDPHGELQLVRARDFLDLDLSRVRLVALSACQTAGSKVGSGAETFGFLRGLMGAGVRTVVLTEWSVDDTSVGKWFAAFYSAIRQGTLAGAARSAALAILETRRHPFFWATPTVYGAWR